MRKTFRSYALENPNAEVTSINCRHFRNSAFVLILCLLAPFPSWCQSVPEFFGVYGTLDGKLAAMIGGKGNFTPPQSSIQVLDYLNGQVSAQGALVLQGSDLRFLVFDAAVADASSSVELYKLPYARNSITRPDALGQLGALYGSKPVNTTAPMQKYVLAKAADLKIELLQKPVPGQPQMVQLVPESDLEPGIYGLFANRTRDGQEVTLTRVFEWKGSSGATETPFCIDMLGTGGYGGMMEDHDARLEHPYFIDKHNYVPCSGGAASSPAGSSGTINSNTGESGAAAALCNDYDGCIKAGLASYQDADWSGASSAFASAGKLRPTIGTPWYWLGIVLLRDGQPHRAEELSDFWNKALSLGGVVAIPACHEKTLQPCERGTLRLSVKAVSFSPAGSTTSFSVAPSEIEPGRILNTPSAEHISYSMKIDGKNYAFDFVPPGLERECTFNLMVQCPTDGAAKQLLLAQFISGTVPELASGTLK